MKDLKNISSLLLISFLLCISLSSQLTTNTKATWNFYPDLGTFWGTKSAQPVQQTIPASNNFNLWDSPNYTPITSNNNMQSVLGDNLSNIGTINQDANQDINQNINQDDQDDYQEAPVQAQEPHQEEDLPFFAKMVKDQKKNSPTQGSSSNKNSLASGKGKSTNNGGYSTTPVYTTDSPSSKSIPVGSKLTSQAPRLVGQAPVNSQGYTQVTPKYQLKPTATPAQQPTYADDYAEAEAEAEAGEDDENHPLAQYLDPDVIPLIRGKGGKSKKSNKKMDEDYVEYLPPDVLEAIEAAWEKQNNEDQQGVEAEAEAYEADAPAYSQPAQKGYSSSVPVKSNLKK